MKPGRAAVLVWLLALAACLAIVVNSRYTADMSAFLPSRPSAEQQLLVEQIKDGSLSRLLLIGIEGGDAAGRAAVSRALAARLGADGHYAWVRNGDGAALARDRQILFEHRYVLSPAVDAARFSVEGLRAAISDSIDLLASPAGLMVKGLLTRDPTGELVELLGRLAGSTAGPTVAYGVWVSRDGRRALLMAQTAAAGADTDGQQAALERLRAEFAAARAGIEAGIEAEAAAGGGDLRLLVSGMPVFSTDARATIQAEVKRLSLAGSLGIVCLLLLVYRSWLTLALGLLPVLSGALAGIAAVGLGFGTVHGLTIGFGTTLIGEAVDYSIYYFVQARHGAAADADWRDRFWPTIRLGVLTSICGFASLLFSGFPGLAQLGLYSIAGLLAAAAVTRFVLPQLCPAGFRIRDSAAIGRGLDSGLGQLGRLPGLRWGLLLLAAAACAVLAGHRQQLWNSGLADLSPMPAAAMALDQSLRGDLGAPEQRYLVAISAADREAALQAAERVAERLQERVEAGDLAGFETPSRYLPSLATQAARRAALPEPEALSARLPQALAGLPLRADKLAPFVADVGAAAQRPPLEAEALAGSSLGLAVDAMLLQRASSQWLALLPLRAGDRELAGAVLSPALAAAAPAEARFVDMAGESNRLYAGYLDEAIALSLAGFAAIVVLLVAALRSPRRLARVLAPLALAVLLVMAALALAGERLTLLHLVGLLLIVAVGSNYALFFDRESRGAADQAQTLASLAIANATTVIGFGILATSPVPVLHAIGITVGPGAVLALLLSALLAGGRTEGG
jgi:predicted exporter